MDFLREEGMRLMAAQPSETAVGNMVRRGKSVFVGYVRRLSECGSVRLGLRC